MDQHTIRPEGSLIPYQFRFHWEEKNSSWCLNVQSIHIGLYDTLAKSTRKIVQELKMTLMEISQLHPGSLPWAHGLIKTWIDLLVTIRIPL